MGVLRKFRSIDSMTSTLAIITLLTTTGIAVAQTKVTFDDASTLPKGWESGLTGKGAAKWEVVADDTAPSPKNVLR